MKTAILAATILVVGCGAAPSDEPTGPRHYQVSTDGTIDIADAMAACAVWSEFVVCDARAPGDHPVKIAAGAVRDGFDAYAVTDATKFLTIVDADALTADGIDLRFALAHELGHRFGIGEHIDGPALMAADAAATWDRAELSDADRAAYKWWNDFSQPPQTIRSP